MRVHVGQSGKYHFELGGCDTLCLAQITIARFGLSNISTIKNIGSAFFSHDVLSAKTFFQQFIETQEWMLVHKFGSNRFKLSMDILKIDPADYPHEVFARQVSQFQTR